MSRIEQKPVTTVTIRSIIFASIVSILLYSLFKTEGLPYVFGFNYGVVISLIGFYIISFAVIRSLEMDENKAKGYTRLLYFVRIVIYAGLLIIAAFVDQIDLLSAILGTFIVRFIIQSSYFVSSVKKMKL